ncbi:MAG: matrixin family metalloprotease [Clostridia bacterium]|nr:matrixin family metalloprotease [Clostridia bacterium]
MRHEIGHVLGMGHYMGNSIMYPYSSSSVQIYQ